MYVLCKQIVTEKSNNILYATELIFISEHCDCIQAELPPVRAQPRHGPGQGRPGHGGRHEGGPQREAGGGVEEAGTRHTAHLILSGHRGSVRHGEEDAEQTHEGDPDSAGGVRAHLNQHFPRSCHLKCKSRAFFRVCVMSNN